jgi:hypothetical protein
MAVLNVQDIKRSGLDPAYVACAGGGDQFLPSEDTILHVKNGSGGALTVTVVTPGVAAPDVPIADTQVSVPAGDDRFIGPFPAHLYQDPADNLADITYSGVTSLTIAALRVSKP